MGLMETVFRTAAVVVLIASTSCTAKKEVVRDVNRKYIACCDPGLSADDKDMCKWLHDTGAMTLKDWYGNIYEGVWQDCKPGEEPWRKWE